MQVVVHEISKNLNFDIIF